MTANKQHEQAVALNADRVRDAEKALIAYARVKGMRHLEVLEDSYQENSEWLVDLLTDLRHWARNYNLDFDDAVRLSEGHFQCEVDEETDEEATGVADNETDEEPEEKPHTLEGENQ